MSEMTMQWNFAAEVAGRPEVFRPPVPCGGMVVDLASGRWGYGDELMAVGPRCAELLPARPRSGGEIKLLSAWGVVGSIDGTGPLPEQGQRVLVTEMVSMGKGAGEVAYIAAIRNQPTVAMNSASYPLVTAAILSRGETCYIARWIVLPADGA